MAWAKGQTGNANGARKPRLISQQIVAALNEAAEDGPSKLRKVVDKLIALAIAGDVPAIREVFDRVEGKPPQFSTSDAEEFRRATELSDDALAAIAAGRSEGADPPTEHSQVTH